MIEVDYAMMEVYLVETTYFDEDYRLTPHQKSGRLK